MSLWLIAPAVAGEVTTWRYDSNQNRLEFTTDQDVQPRAQLVFDPTRLVIDLPGTSMGQAPVSQTVGGAIQQIRIGQFDAQTTRIVVELAPGYTFDPQQVRFRGVSPTQWTVQLPQPQAISVGASGASSASNSRTSNSRTSNNASNATRNSAALSFRGASVPDASQSASNQTATRSRTRAVIEATPPAETDQAADQANQPKRSATRDLSETRNRAITQINGIEITDTGLLLNTEGSAANVSIERSRRGGTITVRFDQARLSPQFRGREREIDRHGVDDLEIKQDDETVEITLDVSRRSPDWQSQASERGRVLLLPQVETAATPTPSRTAVSPQPRVTPAPTPTPTPARLSVATTPAPTPAPPTVQQATVQGIDLDVSGSQLLIQTDRPVSHQAQWQGGMYVVTLSPARLAERVSGPQLTPVDPLRRVRLRQVDDQTVAISIQPATGVQFGSLNLVTPQMLALDMQRPSAAQSISPGRAANSSVRPLPSVIPNGRIIVVIDPGHGGADPGAVGIGNLYEAPVALAISQQVATLLQQQGIQAVLTRSSDVEVELEPRVQMAEQMRANLFVSIHANSMGMDRPDVNGIETYYYSNGEALASVIQNSIVSSLDMRDRGIKQARFYVLRHTSMPAVLVETGYVTGEEDAPRLADASFQNQMAIAIARGILQYIQQNSLTGSR